MLRPARSVSRLTGRPCWAWARSRRGGPRRAGPRPGRPEAGTAAAPARTGHRRPPCRGRPQGPGGPARPWRPAGHPEARTAAAPDRTGRRARTARAADDETVDVETREIAVAAEIAGSRAVVCLGGAEGVGDALVHGISLPVDAVRVDLQQDRDAVPGAPRDLGGGHPGVQPQRHRRVPQGRRPRGDLFWAGVRACLRPPAPSSRHGPARGRA
jgi:hypothetical protein